MNIDPSESWRWQDDPKAREVFNICRKMIAGEVGIAEACHGIEDVLQAMWRGYCDWGHKDFAFIREIVKATREFPFGPPRQHWSVEALKSKDEDLKPIEAQFRERALLEAERILRYENAA